jgi:predicted Zn-dependent protease
VEAPYDARVALVQRLPSAEVHGLLREVGVARGQSATERQRRWRQDLDEQLAEDPLHPEALAARAVADKRSGVEELRRSVQARPQDPRGWHRLADQLEDHGEVPKDLAVRAEVEAALRRALALAPAEATLNNELAWFLAKDGRSGEALPLARMAVALAPWNASIIDTLAFVQADLGHCPEALALQDRAVDLSPRNARLNARLRQYLASCGRAGERGR